MRALTRLAAGLLLSSPACLMADSHAYVVATGANETTPGSITPFNTAQATIGAAFFVPSGGSIIRVPPGTREIWEAAANGSVGAIHILNSRSGSTLASIPLPAVAVALTFDTAGKYAYASLNNGDLLKIAVASHMVQTVSLGTGIYAFNSGLVVSGDGSRLFLDLSSEVLVIDTQSLQTIDTIALPTYSAAIFLVGSTLLAADGNELLYFDTSTLQQTNSASVPPSTFVFGVSPDGSTIYLNSYCCGGGLNTIESMDFASGQILLTQVFANINLANLFLSPDGSQIVVASNPVLLVDPRTLATTKTIWSAGIPISAAYLDPDTIVMLNVGTGAMMVIDQTSAQVTATFPLGLSPIAGEVADPSRGLIFTGASNAAWNALPNVISSELNRIVKNLEIPGGFTPAAIGADQLYGAVTPGITEVYNLMTGRSGSLPPPLMPPQGDNVVSARLVASRRTNVLVAVQCA